MISKRLISLTLSLLLWTVLPTAQGQQTPSASTLTPPPARSQHAPQRDYDLQHISLDLTIDYAKRSFQGVVVNTLTPLRDGLRTLPFDCGANLTVTACEIDGRQIAFLHEGDRLKITSPQPLPVGKSVAVTVRYADDGKKQIPAFHWLQPTAAEPQRIGFWTTGEPSYNRQWLPTWDNPDDFATTEIRVTVPSEWYVISNGLLESDTRNADGKTRTFQWKMHQPFATYLISLVGAPMDIKTAQWRGVKLMYAVPRGKGDWIAETFGDTPDMLSFFSDTLGVKYPWPKYAQTVTYDFPGGMENVSASTLEEATLVDKRNGFKTSVSGIAHELAHQWFGDLVTCKQWGELWLNEGFADFFCDLYQEHVWGKTAYDYVISDSIDAYLSESRRYKRPLSTPTYTNAASAFDSHSYKKGAAFLHTLRRTLGDRAFFAGLHHYLTQNRHQPVDSHDLCTAMTEATGVNLEPFFDQWVYKPGHPVMDYTWRWDAAKRQVLLTIRQTQDTTDGTPIYDLNVTVGLIGNKGLTRQKVRIHQQEQEVDFNVAVRPRAVLLDPDHDLLREIPALHWTAEELPCILKYASNPVDRERALSEMLAGTPSDAMVREVMRAVRADKRQYPVFRDIQRLGELKREDLRPLFREQWTHRNYDRRAQGIRALGQLPMTETDIQSLRGLVNDREPYAVVGAAVSTLSNWDAPANRDIFRKATKLASPADRIRLLALDGLAKADAAEGIVSDPDPQRTQTLMRFLSDRAHGVLDSPVMAARQRAFTASQPKINAMVAGFLQNLESFVPLACDDVEARGIEKSGERIRYLCLYKMITGHQVMYFQFFLTEEGKVAAVDTLPL